MLVCSISMRPLRRAIAADLAETVTAVDVLGDGSGQIVFATLVDDPASVNDTVDAYLGEIMLEAASASDSADAGLSYGATISEAGTGTDAPDATVTSAPASTTWNPSDNNVTLSGGNLTATASTAGTGVRTIGSHTTGKWYYEFTVNNSAQLWQGVNIGPPSALSALSGANNGCMVAGGNGGVYFSGGYQSITISGFAALSAGDVIGVALDGTNHRVWFRRNGGSWNANASYDPATNVGGVDISSFMGAGVAVFAGFGANGAAGSTTNFGGSAFVYSLPSGFAAWG